MGDRPLRQYYGTRAPMTVSGGPDDVVVPWRRHRERFSAELAGLDESEWYVESRCDGWDMRQVVNHLSTADAFWMASLLGATTATPTTFLDDFDPDSTPGEVIASIADDDPETVLTRFEEATVAFIGTVDMLEAEHWSETAESPVGHVTARLALGHALWDSWLHERDILIPLGRKPELHADEVLVATWYSLAIGGLQGGLVDDWGPADTGPEAPVEASLRFGDLPEVTLEIRVTDRAEVSIIAADAPGAGAAGSAVALVEAFTGREPIGDIEIEIDDGLRAHFTRAGAIL